MEKVFKRCVCVCVCVCVLNASFEEGKREATEGLCFTNQIDKAFVGRDFSSIVYTALDKRIRHGKEHIVEPDKRKSGSLAVISLMPCFFFIHEVVCGFKEADPYNLRDIFHLLSFNVLFLLLYDFLLSYSGSIRQLLH